MTEPNAGRGLTYPKLQRIVASITLTTFLITQTNTVFGAPQSDVRIKNLLGDSEVPYDALINKIVIPQELGTVQERFDGGGIAPNQQIPLVVHIQDAHASYEAQKNIQALVRYLNEQYGFSLVLLEGGVEKLVPSQLQIFKNSTYNSEMIDYLMKKSEVSGPEAYLVGKSYEQLNKSEKIDAYGLESAEAYRRDLEQFRKIWQNTEKGRDFALQFAKLVDRAGSRLMSKELRSFLKQWQTYKESRSHLNFYLTTLETTAKTILNLDLHDPRNQRNWPLLLRIFKLKEIELNLKIDQAKKEWVNAKSFLNSIKTNPKLLAEIEDRLSGKEVLPASQAESTRVLFERLLAYAFPKGFTFKKYPQFSMWVGNVLLRNEIDGIELFSEIDRLNDQIFNRLAKSGAEKQVVVLLKQSYFLRDLFSLELTRDDFLKVKAATGIFKPSEVVQKIRSIDSSTSYASPHELAQLDALFNECMKSYEFAIARESAFFENIVKAFRETGKDRAISVTGGFHTTSFHEDRKSVV